MERKISDREAANLSDEEISKYFESLEINNDPQLQEAIKQSKEEEKKRQDKEKKISDLLNPNLYESLISEQKNDTKIMEENIINYLKQKPEFNNFKFELIKVRGDGKCLFYSLSKIIDLNADIDAGIKLREDLYKNIIGGKFDFIIPKNLENVDNNLIIDHILKQPIIDFIKTIQKKNDKEALEVNIKELEKEDYNPTKWLKIYSKFMLKHVDEWGKDLDYKLYAIANKINIKVITYDPKNNKFSNDMDEIIMDTSKPIHYLVNTLSHFDYLYIYQVCPKCKRENSNISDMCINCGELLPKFQNRLNRLNNKNKYLKYKNKYIKLKKNLRNINGK